ncbi:MAG: hypothetical protein P4K97_02740 [Terracidiphilus sp.]|nr:hypothetical protein [Terracidiphilus sp.]
MRNYVLGILGRMLHVASLGIPDSGPQIRQLAVKEPLGNSIETLAELAGASTQLQDFLSTKG